MAPRRAWEWGGVGECVALVDGGRLGFGRDRGGMGERFVLLRGTEAQIRALHSPKILSAVHEPYGSTALAEYPDETMTAGLEASAPTLAELLFHLQKGGCIS